MRCQCGSCQESFDLEEIEEKTRKIYGIEITEKCCPYCGAIGFTPYELYDKVAKINDHKRSFYDKVIEGWWS